MHKPSAAAASGDAPQIAADVVLVGCTQSKAASARPAAELFTGACFVKARALAERSGKPWYVLSGKWGVPAPDDVVAPYDVYLGNQGKGYQQAWGAWVLAQLRQLHRLEGAVVEVHAGSTYVEPLRRPLAAAGATLRTPLAGLPMGKQLAWYGEPTGSVRAPEPPTCPSCWARRTRLRRRPSSPPAGRPPTLPVVYAGRAGGQRASGKVSTNTLWGRIATMHLGGNRTFSTFRLTLAAVLTQAGLPMDDEARLTAWMGQHLRVATLALPPADVVAAEQRLLELADPPLNLRDVERTTLRRRLTELRSAMADH